MLKSTLTLFICTLFGTSTFVNIDLIDISKISSDSKYTEQFNFVKDNKKYYAIYSPEWKYDKPKAELISQLTAAYTSFSAIKKKNSELYLLLGDISHYLYNMDVSEYKMRAVTNYGLAIKDSPQDVRGPWFLGYHYALANEAVNAVKQFSAAKKLPLGKYAVFFWNDFGYQAILADMPSTALHAMKRAREITGNAESLERTFGENVSKRFADLDRDKEYKSTDIWIASTKAGAATFTSRPLAIKMQFDSASKISGYPYKDRKTAFMIMPPKLKSKDGKEIGYSILLLTQVAKDGETLSDYLDGLTKDKPNRKKLNWPGKYNNILAYEISNKDVYPEWGGSHTYTIGIERNAPETPGLLLEEPIVYPPGKQGGGSKLPNRFTGRIMYIVAMDTCEDIHEESLALFKKFLENELIIE